MLISGILAGFCLEKFRFSIFKISRKLVFLGRVSKFLEGCRALRRDPALPVAEAMAEAPDLARLRKPQLARRGVEPVARAGAPLCPCSPRAPRGSDSLSCFL